MADFPLLISVLTTILIVILISGAVSRLRSLPVDVVTAAVSLVLLFADSAYRYQEANPTLVSPYALLIAAFIYVVSAILSVMTIGIHLTSESERKTLPSEGMRYGSLFTEAGYCLALLLATLFIVMAFLVASSAPIILSKSHSQGGELFLIVDEIARKHDLNTLFRFALFMYAVALLIRYGRLIMDPVRKLLNKWVF